MTDQGPPYPRDPSVSDDELTFIQVHMPTQTVTLIREDGNTGDEWHAPANSQQHAWTAFVAGYMAGSGQPWLNSGQGREFVLFFRKDSYRSHPLMARGHCTIPEDFDQLCAFLTEFNPRLA